MVRLSGCRRAERAESGRKRKRIGTFGRRGGAKDLIGAAVVARGMTVDVIIIGGRPLVRGIVEGGHSEWWHRRRGRREFSHGLHRRRGLARSPSESRAAGRAQGAALARGGRREWRCVNWLLHLGLTMCGGLYQASGRAIFFTPVTLSAPFGSRTQSPTESRGLVISARYTLTPHSFRRRALSQGTAQSTTRNHEGLHAGSTQREDLALKNVHVSRAPCISTRVFLTREASEWECLTAAAPSNQAAGMQARRAWVKKPPGPC